MKVIPTAWEVERGLLRRTPGLKALEAEEGRLVLLLEGERVELQAAPDGAFYQAAALFALCASRTVLKLRPARKGEVWVEALEPKPAPQRAKEPEETPQSPPPPRARRRVRLLQTAEGWKEVVEPEAEGPRPPSPVKDPLEALPLLLRHLNPGEEFAPEGAASLLEFHGFEPSRVWQALEGRGVLKRRRDGFAVLVLPKAPAGRKG